MGKVADFLEELSSNDVFEKKFDDTPDAAMDQFDLDKDQRKLVRNGTAKEIREQVEKDRPGEKFIVFRVKMG
jgi:restriction endonuclease Mrr